MISTSFRRMVGCLALAMVTLGALPASSLAEPKRLNIPPSFVPQASDFAGKTTEDLYLDIGGLYGRPLKPINGQHAVYVTRVPETGYGDKFAVGDIITGVQGRAFAGNALHYFKRRAEIAQRGNGSQFRWHRWRNGRTEEITIEFGPRTPPDLTAGGYHDPDEDPWNLGPTGAEGWIWAVPHKTTEGATQVYITSVKPDTPADGVLKEGDVVIGAFGEKFTWDARKEFAHALTRAETEEAGGRLKLTVWHDGQTREAIVPIKVMGRYSDTAPYDCEKSKRIVDDAVAYLKEHGLGAGRDKGRKSIYEVVNALGLLATGRDDVMPMVKEKVDELAAEFPSDHTWTTGYRLLLLTEYHL
ncbi:MAG: DUF6288 domain-containing protein, partial [Phycisphaeraceae bacterium]|nr:DUF6288 domain-containing protein [Phycisphaeraceae bacterium]